MMKTLITIFLLIQLIVSIQAGLKQLADEGNCSFYTELEKTKKCGANGYLIQYGYMYCNKFGEYYKLFNKDGQKWVNSVRKCLMNKLYAKSSLNCNQLKNYAFDTHVTCYLNPGYSSKGICDIWLSNAAALWKVYNLKDFLSPSAMKQVLSTAYNCGIRLF